MRILVASIPSMIWTVIIFSFDALQRRYNPPKHWDNE